MGYTVKEVKSMPEGKDRGFSDEIPALLDAAMESETGIVAVKFDTVEECHSRTATLTSWIKRHKLNEVFIIRQRIGTAFIKEVRTAERHGLNK